MGIHRALLFCHFPTIFVLMTLSFLCQASDDHDRKVHIVYMGALSQGIYSPTSQHLSLLASVLEGSSVSESLIRSYNRSFSGFAAKLTDPEIQKLASKEEVISIFPREIYHTHTTRSWDFMGMPLTAKRNPTVESDIVIGDIDTGIWPGSDSFGDKGFGPPPKKWKGACKGGLNFTCNNKVIGARFYASERTLMNSAIDELGHGTHTASTAAGNSVKGASFFDIAKGTARGGVPSARIAVYKVCDEDVCFSDGIMAAFDDAIADGVDVITISLGISFPMHLDHDPIAIGSFHAAVKGILTVNSAGNSGPGLGSITSVAPWIFTAAASSTDRKILDKVVLGNGKTFTGHSINGFTPNGTLPLINGTESSPNCADGVCHMSCPNSTFAKGKIVWCDYAASSAIGETFRAGAMGVILPEGPVPDISMIVPLPASVLSYPGFPAVAAYLNSTSKPVATILKSEGMKDTKAPAVCSFSSRGPNTIAPDILKPDIAAPGREILAAFPPTCSPTAGMDDKRRVRYTVKSGTSMACPHVAGVAAYVKTFHPNWSPSAIKSAIMTTAAGMNDRDIHYGEFAFGSGHVNPERAVSPGLVYEALEEDYIGYLCSIGYNAIKLRLILGHNATCPPVSPKHLNYPSMAAKVSEAGEAFRVEFHRTAKNVGLANSTYRAIVDRKPEFEVEVVPEILTFRSLYEEKPFVVTVKGRGLGKNTMVSTSLMWYDGVHRVNSPIVVYNVIV